MIQRVTIPEISVVIPVYKGVRFLSDALESVRRQTFSDWECICVDDGSTDGSGAVADKVADMDRRIRVLHRENGGTSVARNAALASAQGRYVAFLDEDDIYHPRYLEVLYSAIETNKADVAGLDFVSFDEDSNPVFEEPPSEANSICTFDMRKLRDRVADWYAGMPWEVWRHLYRRDSIAGVKFPVGVRVEQDLCWHYELLPRFRRYTYIPWAGYGWRRNSNGGALNPCPKSLISEVRTFRRIAETLPRNMSLSEEQTALLKFNMSCWCKAALYAHVRRGVNFNRDESAEFRKAVRELRNTGVDERAALGARKRLLWNLFMLSGWEGFIRI